MKMKKTVEAEPERVRELIAEHIPEATEECAERLVRYYEKLIEWNNMMNLTAVTDPEGVVLRHFADSIAGAPLIPEGARCIDVGTGAGFPGLPLKLMRPDIELTLLDSLNKRIKFLNNLTEELGISAIAVHSRAEDAGQNPIYREKYDIALSRAVAPLNLPAEWTLPFVKTGGASLMYKGPAAEEELAGAAGALSELRAEAEVKSFPASWGERNLVVVRKRGRTPAKYPRRAGSAEKAPL